MEDMDNIYANNHLLDEGLLRIFAKYDIDARKAVESIDNAKKKSVRTRRVERKTILENIDLKNLGKTVAFIVLSASLTIGGGALVETTATEVIPSAIQTISSNFDNSRSMEQLSKEIGALVYEGDEQRLISIVSQNTYRNENGPYYNQEDIAKDLLKLDSNLFDYAFCAVCNDMGNNINNKVGIAGRTNIDAVIYYLNFYANVNGGITPEYVAERFQNVDSLNAYLVKFGYIDENGNPSLEAFKKACDEKTDVIYDILHSEDRTQGVSF